MRAWREFWRPALKCARVGHAVADYRRTGTRRSSSPWYVAERVKQERQQCDHCGQALSEWSDLPEYTRGFTGYSAPAAKHDRVMYGDGDWDAPYRARAPQPSMKTTTTSQGEA